MDFEDDIDLMTAEELRTVTADPEEIYQKQKHSITQSLMDTMVKKARQEGKTTYTASFLVDLGKRLVPDLKEQFEKLNFKTQVNETNDGKQIDLTLDWSE